MQDDPRCPSTYSPGRAVVMTTPFEPALRVLAQQVETLPPEPPSRTIEALLVQLEQMLERTRVAGGTVAEAEFAAETARHALISGDLRLAADALQDAVFLVIRASHG
jgi:putative NIF3 family GTP cyclohydrolase 1 type 2